MILLLLLLCCGYAPRRTLCNAGNEIASHRIGLEDRMPRPKGKVFLTSAHQGSISVTEEQSDLAQENLLPQFSLCVQKRLLICPHPLIYFRGWD